MKKQKTGPFYETPCTFTEPPCTVFSLNLSRQIHIDVTIRTAETSWTYSVSFIVFFTFE